MGLYYRPVGGKGHCEAKTYHDEWYSDERYSTFTKGGTTKAARKAAEQATDGEAEGHHPYHYRDTIASLPHHCPAQHPRQRILDVIPFRPRLRLCPRVRKEEEEKVIFGGRRAY